MFNIHIEEPLVYNAAQIAEREMKILCALESGEKTTVQISILLGSTREKTFSVLSRLRRAGRIKRRLVAERRVCDCHPVKTKIAYWRLA